MHRIYILIDFENVQPTAKDLSLIRGSQYKVRIFHGPHQTKFDAGVVKALQPLGMQVEYVQCSRNGKNALDFHVAFHLGRLIEEREKDGVAARAATHFLVVSKDGGFDALLEHIRSLGYQAAKSPDIKEVMAIGAVPEPLLAPPRPVSDAAPAPQVAKPKPKAPGATKKKAALDIRQKLIDNLRVHPTNRPSNRQALLRHAATVIGSKQVTATVETLIAGLERDGIVVAFDDRIDYVIPKTAK